MDFRNMRIWVDGIELVSEIYELNPQFTPGDLPGFEPCELKLDFYLDPVELERTFEQITPPEVAEHLEGLGLFPLLPAISGPEAARILDEIDALPTRED